MPPRKSKSGSGSSSSSAPKPPPQAIIPPADRTIFFSTVGCSTKKYQEMIEECTEFLCPTQHLGIPLVSSDNHYFFIELDNIKKHKITLLSRKYDFYIVGFRSDGRVFYFSDIELTLQNLKRIFNDHVNNVYNYIPIHFRCNYIDLQTKSKLERRSLGLGIGKLDSCISELAMLDTKDPGFEERTARGILACIQLIAESARLKRFNARLANTAESRYGIYPVYFPDDFDVTSQNKWVQISEKVLQATGEDEYFDKTIELAMGKQWPGEDNLNEMRIVDSVSVAKKSIRILKSRRDRD